MKRLLRSAKNKTLLYIILGSSLFLLIAIFNYPTENLRKLDKKEAKMVKDKATISIEPLHFSQEIEKKSKYILSADSAKFFQEKGKGVLRNFSLTYIYNGGKKLTLSGAKAVVNINADKDLSNVDMSIANIYSRGKITAVSSEGYTFETEKLLWNGSKRVISTTEPIILYGNNFKVTGEGLKADIDNERMEIVSKVSVTATQEALKNIKSKSSNLNKSSSGKSKI
ncbi:MAG: LPS export ABC transporter periplasmic protein LptC [Candidatus Schekmanbacteria bacterium RBG_16_38_11]|uniref:LPS export ABC transporter periplasmic protein LptC n=1 Tax=Candidatus Schekmanbacteria bacterium RBG_16_38_11 TaxID=1817880 RepID=A0A1F7RXN5_9BACT|nr:MAG: LPS export ABC transporter periplasmic protein LptC [Candidatus Schekmanbacteria bacterium RBG_16_38_11]